MRSVYNFWCISFVSNEFLKHVQKTPKSWEKFCLITIFHRNPQKNFYRLEKLSKLPFCSHLFFRQSWTKVLRHFRVSGAFPMHTGPTPPLTSQTMLDECIKNFFRVQLFIGWGGKTARKFRKGCTV